MAHLNLALSLLICGVFARGWDELVWIRRLPNQRDHYPNLGVTLWNGEEFAGGSP
jgi:hypothetical protein